MSSEMRLSVCLLFGLLSVFPASAATLEGTAVYEDGDPVAGAVIYALPPGHRFRVSNNEVLAGERAKRGITDGLGWFEVAGVSDGPCSVFARDMEDQCAFVAGVVPGRPAEIVFPKPTRITGGLFNGPEAVSAQDIHASLLTDDVRLSYTAKTRTNADGAFQFCGMMPGTYKLQVIEEVPQVGCCFRSVVTKQTVIDVRPGETAAVKLGGTDWPYLHGTVAEPDGTPLHGVWVRLLPKAGGAGDVVWSTVTERDGSYAIYDIPPGDYEMRCFRRLALNNYARTLTAKRDVAIPAAAADAGPDARENRLDVAIDLEPFMPLEIGTLAPELTAELLSGEPFDLAEQRGKLVVLYFHAGWCKFCKKTTPEIDRLFESFPRDQVTVVGISLDESLEECRDYVRSSGIRHPQIYAGAWNDSPIRKAFRVVGVPSTVIIDRDGNIAQYGLFGDVLVNFIKKRLEPQAETAVASAEVPGS